jgi:hypothetical protein
MPGVGAQFGQLRPLLFTASAGWCSCCVTSETETQEQGTILRVDRLGAFLTLPARGFASPGELAQAWRVISANVECRGTTQNT